MKKTYISAIILCFILALYFQMVSKQHDQEDTKTLERYSCGTFDLTIKMDVRRNAFEGDGVAYTILYDDNEFKNLRLYSGSLYSVDSERREEILPLNSSIQVATFSTTGKSLVDIYIPNLDSDSVGATKQFTDAEFQNLVTCMQKNETSIATALQNLKLSIAEPVLKRTSNLLTTEMPRLGSVIHIDKSGLQKKIIAAFDNKTIDGKIFTDEKNGYRAVFVNYRGDIQYTTNLSLWKLNGGGDVGVSNISTVFTANLETNSLSEYGGVLEMTAEDGTKFKDYLVEGQKKFGIKFE